MEPCQEAAHSSRIAASKTLSFMPHGAYLKVQKPLGLASERLAAIVADRRCAALHRPDIV